MNLGEHEYKHGSYGYKSKWRKCTRCLCSHDEDGVKMYEFPASVPGFTDLVCQECLECCAGCDEWITPDSIDEKGEVIQWDGDPCHQKCYDECVKELQEGV